MVMCELVGVGKKYDGKIIFDSLSFEINQGEMIAITGPSGSGKSTILNMIGLLERPDAGTINLFGKPAPKINSSKSKLLLRNKIAYLFQNYALVDNETTDYNLNIALEYVKATKTQKRQMKIDALNKVGLDETYLKKKIYQLSGGEQQRIAVARIILKPCELILADEPTGSLDVQNRNEIIKILQELNKSGKTIIIVTHDEYVADQCERKIELQ